MAIAAAYVDATTLTVAGNLADELLPDGAAGLAVRADCGVDGYKYGHVLAASYVDPATSVSFVGDALTANLVGIEHGNDGPRSMPCTPVLRGWREGVLALGAIAVAAAVDLRQGNVVTATLTGAVTLTLTNPAGSGFGCGFVLYLTNGGAYTITWPTNVKWAGGFAPTLTASGLDILAFQTIDGGTTWRGLLAGKDVK